MAEALVSIALEVVRQQLTEVAGQQLSLFAGPTRELEKLSLTFESVQAILADAEARQVGNQSLQLWLSRVRRAAYDIQDLLEDWRISGLGSGNDDDDGDAGKSVFAAACLSWPYACLVRIVCRYNLVCSIKEIKQRLDQIDDERKSYGFISCSQSGGDDRTLARSQRNHGEDDRTLLSSKRLTTGLIDESEMFIGRENDKETMISKLVSGSSQVAAGQVQVVAVVGIGGLGKTTLAQQIYNDCRVRDHFNTVLYWVCVSDVFDTVRITREILEQVKKPDNPPSGLHALQKELQKELEGKHFLLVLDDVWNEDKEEWKKLRLPLNSIAQGSRILITTRSQKVAETMNATHIHDLKGLSDDDSWELFRISAFAGKKPEEYLEFENVGREIAKNCNGVPLSIKVIGCAMYSKMTMEDWQNVLKSKIWSLRQARDEILPALLLTYCHLPPYLKQCFAYCSVFPEDWKFKKDVLVKLWVAQGFIQPDGNREKEDIGNEYFDELVARSMFQKVKENNKGPPNICKMHDLLHDLAELIAKDEIYTFISKSKGGKSEECPSHNVRHAFLSFADGDGKSSNILVAARRAEKLRTLWLDRTAGRPSGTVGRPSGTVDGVIDDLIHEARFLRALYLPFSTSFPKSIAKLKHLTYLCLPHSNIVKLPDAIGKMQQLRYLDLSRSAIVELPESVSDLRSLHTLQLSFCRSLKKLPTGIGRMVGLRHLQIEGIPLDYLPKGLGRLSCLRSLCAFIVGGGDEGRGCGIGELQQLNSLQGSLCIRRLERVSGQEEAEKARLWEKRHLRHLALSMSAGRHDDVGTERIDGVLEGLRPPENLEKLELYGCTGSKLPSWMDGMPRLPKLALRNGPKLERVPHLPSLKEFEINGVRNVTLPGEGWGRLVALQKLMIWQCMELKCLPEGLGQLKKLKALHVGRSAAHMLLHCGVSEVLRCLPDSLGQLESLQSLFISSCEKLESLPDSLGQLKKLKSLRLVALKALRCLPDSLGQLESLESLCIDRCRKLKSLPVSLGQLKKLKELHIDCSDGSGLKVAGLGELRSLPDSVGQLESLGSLHIENCWKLESLPDSLGQLKKLKTLNVSGSGVLRCLPDSLGQLESLESLDITECQNLESLPDSLGQLKKLKTLNVRGSGVLRCLPDSLGQLESLEHLYIYDLKKLESLPDSLGQLKKLKTLNVSGSGVLRCLPDTLELESLESLHIENCLKLESLPDSLGQLKKLKKLHVCGSGVLRCLPDSIGQLESLEHLYIYDLKKLESLPDSLGQLKKLKTLNVGRSGAHMLLHRSVSEVLRCLPDSLGQLESLESLSISSCEKLESLPDSLGQLKKLKSLRLVALKALRCLPDSLGQLESLESLCIDRCWKLKSLPVSLGQLKKLKELHIDRSDGGGLKVAGLGELRSLPDSVGQLESLESLHIENYWKLESLPDSLGQLKKLKTLHVRSSGVLRCLPDSLGQLESLEHLLIYSCEKLVSLPDSLGQLKKLKKLNVSGSGVLRCLPDSLGQLESLKDLSIGNLKRLESMPVSLGQLKKLESLAVHGSGVLTFLPDSIEQLESLDRLYISSCKKLASLPDSLGRLKKLKNLHVDGLEVLRYLPDSLGQLESLENLDITKCQNLDSLPDSLGHLKKLKRLNVGLTFNPSEMVGVSVLLRYLPDSLGQLESLVSLRIANSDKLESLPNSLGQLKALTDLEIRDCKALASLPQGLRHLSLQRLTIDNCPLLWERYKREGGVDWPNISHIPNVVVKGSEDDRYFDAEPNWLESDDDFHSVSGDFTPSSSSTPQKRRSTTPTEASVSNKKNKIT